MQLCSERNRASLHSRALAETRRLNEEATAWKTQQESDLRAEHIKTDAKLAEKERAAQEARELLRKSGQAAARQQDEFNRRMQELYSQSEQVRDHHQKILAEFERVKSGGGVSSKMISEAEYKSMQAEYEHRNILVDERWRSELEAERLNSGGETPTSSQC